MRVLILIFLIVVCVGCIKDKSTKEDVKIIKIICPTNSDNKFYEGNIFFKSSENIEGLSWEIDNLYVGDGNTCIYNFCEGVHEIKLKYKEAVADKININVIKKDMGIGEWKKVTLFEGENRINFETGKYTVAVVNESMSKKDFLFSDLTTIEAIQANAIKKSVRLRVVNSDKTKRSIEDENERNFKVIDIESDYSDSFINIHAKKIFEGINCNIYVDVNSVYEIERIKQIGLKTDTQIIKRDKQAFGEFTDVDGNGKINILMTDYLNKTKIAYGFFISSDLFPENAENKISNFQEIVYTGVPDNELFTPLCIEATISHEIQHLINFSNKSYRYMQKGYSEIPIEEVSLNEGLSHLAEDINGYNLSGGNIKCIKAFINSPESYSLFFDNDSIGRRGAVYLFLRYLIDTNGGINYAENGDIINSGGADLLKKLVYNEETGINNLEKVFNSNIIYLYDGWIEYILKCKYRFHGKDIFTGENYGFQMNYKYNDTLTIGEVQTNNVVDLSLSGYSFAVKKYEIAKKMR